MTTAEPHTPSEALPPPTADHARAQVGPLRQAVAGLNRETPTLIEGWADGDLALFLGLLQAQLADLRAIEAYAGHVLGDRLGRTDTRWPDGMRAAREARYREKWAEDTDAAVTHDLTELPGDLGEGARLMLARLREVARFGYRVTGVKPYAGAGLDELHHRERTHWAVKVSLPAGAASGGTQ